MIKVCFRRITRNVGGMCTADGTIVINTDCGHPQKRRYMVSCFVHELTHWILDRIWGLPDNPYESYCQEVWCYQLQYMAEVAMGMPRPVDREKGAILSTADFIRQLMVSNGHHV